MARNKTALFIVAASLVTGALAAALVHNELQSNALQVRASLREVPVVVAARAVPAGARLSRADVRLAMVPQGGRTRAAFTALRPALGLLSRQALYPGEQLLPQMLVAAAASPNLADHVPPGMLAMSVLYNPVTQAGGALTPGDRVAVLAVVGRGYDGRKVDAAQVIMDRVQVLSTPGVGLGAQVGAAVSGAGAPATASNGAQSIVLAVTPQQAQRIAFASTYGQIELLLDAANSRAAPLGAPVTDGNVLP